MRFLLFLAALLGSFQAVQAQDLIVTDKSDSLNCKITKIKSDFIHFTFKYENEIRNTLLPVGQIKFYKKDFFEKAEVPADKIKNFNGNYPKFRVGISGGWSYLTARVSNSVPPAFQNYLKELKSGYHFGGDATYFTSAFLGFGLKYSVFKTTNEINNIYATNLVTGQVAAGRLKDDVTIQYIGPTFCTRFISGNNKTQLLTGFSIGYMHYKNNAIIIENFTMTGKTVGFVLDLAVNQSIHKDLSLEAAFAFVSGVLNQYDYNDGRTTRKIELNKDNLENISRIDLSVGLKWNFK